MLIICFKCKNSVLSKSYELSASEAFIRSTQHSHRAILAKQLNISPHQLSYVTNSGEGEGLLFYGNVILPFIDRFPTDLELYRIMTTKLNEVVTDKEG